MNNVTSDQITSTVELLQDPFTKSWRDLSSTVVPDLEEVAPLLKENPPPTPSIGQVKFVLRHLNPKKATGSDGIPAWVLKRFCEELALVVHNFLCSSIMKCKYPTLYKHALITPVPMVHPPKNIEKNLRQISILPQMTKVLEKIQLKLN